MGWIWAAGFIVAISVINIVFFSEGSIIDGLFLFWEIYSPLNFWNTIMLVVTFAPGVLAVTLEEKLSQKYMR